MDNKHFVKGEKMRFAGIIRAAVAGFCLLGALNLSAEVTGKVIVKEDFEKDLDKKVVVSLFSQPHEVHEIGISAEKARSGKHSVKIDVSYMHHFAVYLTPRTNETPEVKWGSLGSTGGFTIKGLEVPLRADRGYILELYVWVEKATTKNPVEIMVETVADCDYGITRKNTSADQVFTHPTEGWVKVEVELNSFLIDRIAATGAKTEGLRLHSISFNSFNRSENDRMTVYIDDITLREVPMSDAGEYRKKQEEQIAKKREALAFRTFAEVEDLFVWGPYGVLHDPGSAWFKPILKGTHEEMRLQRTEWLRKYTDWMLIDLRRHYCNSITGGGGILFSSDAQSESAYDYVKASLDKCAQYGIKFGASTYLTQHYGSASREKCEEAMRKTAEMFKDHPGLLAYLLVDEPQPGEAEDFYWGKQFMESLDPNHPCICFCNGIPPTTEFAPTLPIVCLDTYWMKPQAHYDPGPWALADTVRYARELGAKRIWPVPQVFGGGGNWRPANAEEFSIQIFSCLAEGATGFIPFVYAYRPGWTKDSGEGLYGTLVDAYGNATAPWEVMKRLGPYVRSAGALLVGAERLGEDAVTAQVKDVVVSNVGRKRPTAVARMFADKKRNARYIVAYNNTRFYRKSFNVAIKEPTGDEKLLDLFSMREIPLTGNTFKVFLMPGDGRIYALGQPAAIAAVKKEVYTNRFDIERDLLALEIELAKRMGTDTAYAGKALSDANVLLKGNKFSKALEKIAESAALLEEASRTNTEFRTVNEAIERSRITLGSINKMMLRCIGDDRPKDFPRDDPQVKAVIDKMMGLSERFYSLQSKLILEGPKGMAEGAGNLLNELQEFERSANIFFGI